MVITMEPSNRFSQHIEENAITRRKKYLEKQGVHIFDASASNPTKCNLIPSDIVFSYFFTDQIKKYSPDPQGLFEVRDALGNFYNAKPEDFFLTASTSEAYSWIFKLLGKPNDTFLIPKPGYPLFDFLAEQELVKLAPYNLEYVHPHGWQIDLYSLEEAVEQYKPKGIIVINPNNPTGSYILQKEYNFLIKICKEHDTSIIADEVFYPFSFNEKANYISFMQCNEIPVFTLNGLSKMLCLPQVKLGWIHVSEQVNSKIRSHLEIIADTFLSPNIFAMTALPKLLLYAKQWISYVQDRIIKNYKQACTFFAYNSPIRVRTAQGGWSVMLELPRFYSDEKLILDLLEQYHLYIQPGFFFDTKEDGIVVPSLILEPDQFTKCLNIINSYIIKETK